MSVLQRFIPLQEAIAKDAWRDERLLVSEIAGLIHVDFYSSPFYPYFEDFLMLLCEEEIASRLKTLRFHSPDTGANGTQHWNFGHMLNCTVDFPKLTHLWIEPYNGVHHNHPIVEYKSSSYDENGILAHWLSKTPNLQQFTSPSAPNADFFKLELSELVILHIQAGYFVQSFISNMAASKGFPKLHHFEYQDYHETYIDNTPENYTPLEHFRELFQSAAFDSVLSFTWYNPIFSMDEIAQLNALRPRLQIKVVHITSEYVRQKRTDSKH